METFTETKHLEKMLQVLNFNNYKMYIVRCVTFLFKHLEHLKTYLLKVVPVGDVEIYSQ